MIQTTGDSMYSVNFERLKMQAGEGYWYLGTAYSKYPGGRDAAYEIACRATGRLMAQSVPVFSPIAMCHGPADFVGLDPNTSPDGEPDPWTQRMAPLERNAMGLLVLRMSGWADSVGLMREINSFKAADKPVIGLSWPMLEVEK